LTRIDLEAIAERHGAKLSVAEFVNRSVCSECGARWPNISTTLEPGGTRGAKMGYTPEIEKKHLAERKARRTYLALRARFQGVSRSRNI
jgi:hypothetical protein